MMLQDMLDLSNQLLSGRDNLLAHWQDIADQFYPERADFTRTRTLGEDFADHLTTSYPILARRELGDTFSSMLRPKDRDWFYLDTEDDADDRDGKAWLEMAALKQRKAMYDRQSGFVRATKQADHDYAAFGQAVISAELARDRTRLLFRNWHLRDVAWRENAEMQIDTVVRKWSPTVTDLDAIFGNKAHSKIREAIRRNQPYDKIDCLHIVIPSAGKYRQPFRSIYIDKTNNHIMEDVGSWSMIYIIPRWQTVSGSQYAHSPAVVAAMPDARTLQAVSLTLLEAGELYTGPPMVAVQDAIRGDIDLRSRGITWVDAQYDERLGEVLRPLTQDMRGYPVGADMRESIREMIAEAFYLNKLSLPPAGGREMTAFEVSQRVQEFIRTTLPLFEPVEDDYNGAICDAAFDLGMRNGLFGPLDMIPKSLRGRNVQFRFVSPLSEAREREKASRWMETRELLLSAAELDPRAPMMLNVQVAVRDALDGSGTPAKWLRSEQEVEDMTREMEEQQAQAAQIQQIGQIAGVAQDVGAAADALGVEEMAA